MRRMTHRRAVDYISVEIHALVVRELSPVVDQVESADPIPAGF